MAKERIYGRPLFLRVDEEVHTLVRASAALKGITLKQWILRAMMEQVKKEKIYTE